MNRLSVIVPSRNASNLMRCVSAIHNHNPGNGLIVVDDGLAESGFDPSSSDYGRGAFLDGSTLISGVKPFIFSRNINIGIRAAGGDDVVLLNDDALLQTPGGFTAMQRAAEEHPEYGIISAACNNVGNPNQHQHKQPWKDRPGGGYMLTSYEDRPVFQGIRDESRTLCFVCVLVPRRTIDKLCGVLMDETFGGIDDRGEEIYGFCDDDACLRVRRAGLKLGIFDECFVDHASLPSSFRAAGPRSLEPGQRHFIKKHGVDNYGQPKETSQWRHLFE